MAPAKKTAAAKPKASSRKKELKPKDIKVADLVIGSGEMAKVLGVSTRRLTQLVTDHGIPSEGRGRFRVAAVVQAYAAFRAEGATKSAGSESLDDLRKEKAMTERLNRERKDRTLISLDEAIGVVDDMTGMFVAALTGLPAQITGVPRERQRLNDIFDKERLRLADRFAERRGALLAGNSDIDPASEDDASAVGT